MDAWVPRSLSRTSRAAGDTRAAPLLPQEDVEKMTADAEKYAKEDEAFKAKVESKNSLENYCYSMKNSLDDEKVKEKIPAEDAEKAKKAIDDALSWLEGNQMAEKEEFEHTQKEVEDICSPIMQAMYSQGAGGGMGGIHARRHGRHGRHARRWRRPEHRCSGLLNTPIAVR